MSCVGLWVASGNYMCQWQLTSAEVDLPDDADNDDFLPDSDDEGGDAVDSSTGNAEVSTSSNETGVVVEDSDEEDEEDDEGDPEPDPEPEPEPEPEPVKKKVVKRKVVKKAA